MTTPFWQNEQLIGFLLVYQISAEIKITLIALIAYDHKSTKNKAIP